MTASVTDDPFCDVWRRMPHALEESYERLIERGPLSLKKMAVTDDILRRLSAFYGAQKAMKTFLGKKYTGAASDFFVETVTFYLKALTETRRLDVEVASERQIRRKRGSIRPDISIWRGDQCLACIECKTQLGYQRYTWEAQFVEREQRLVAEFTGASTFLLVLTSLNWPGFGPHPELGKKYFLLLNDVWPGQVDFDTLVSNVETPIEGLFTQIVQLATVA